MKWSILSWMFLAVCLAGGPAGLSGFTITVDCGGAGDAPTIQAGIDMAANGDTVRVAPCTYTGPANRDIQFNGKAIVVMSSDGPEATIIDCRGLGRGFYFDQNATSGNSIYYYPDSPTVTYSDIEGGWAGTGNVDTDPLFAEAIDSHLASGSPCVDAGDPSIVDGSRPPSLGGTRSDMGAYGGSQNGEWLEGVYDLFLYPTGPTSVTVGDTLFFDALIWNSTANPATGNYWLSIVLPNQTEILIPQGLLNLPNPAYGTTAAHGTNTLSNELRTILTGTYTLIARIGVYPNTVVDEESIEVEVLP